MDEAAHSYGNLRSSRTEILFGEGGHAYVYLIYGRYCCLNASVNVEGKPEAVLIRALEPVDGFDEMTRARNSGSKKGGKNDLVALCSGPGKLCQAMGISRADYGADLCGDELYIEEYREFTPEQIGVSLRINIDYAEGSKDQLWRYFLRDNKFVSKVAKRYRVGMTLEDLNGD